MGSKNKSLVLLSGGIDSYVALALEMRRVADCSSLSFCYDGQPSQEIKAIQEISRRERIPNYIIRHPKIIGDISDKKQVHFSPDNLLYYSIAICFARNNNINRVVGGQNRDDLIQTQNVSTRFYRIFNTLLKESYPNTKIKIIQPLLSMDKTEVVKKGLELGLDLGITWSCQGGGLEPCGICSNCSGRKEISQKLGIEI